MIGGAPRFIFDILHRMKKAVLKLQTGRWYGEEIGRARYGGCAWR